MANPTRDKFRVWKLPTAHEPRRSLVLQAVTRESRHRKLAEYHVKAAQEAKEVAQEHLINYGQKTCGQLCEKVMTLPPELREMIYGYLAPSGSISVRELMKFRFYDAPIDEWDTKMPEYNGKEEPVGTEPQFEVGYSGQEFCSELMAYCYRTWQFVFDDYWSDPEIAHMLQRIDLFGLNVQDHIKKIYLHQVPLGTPGFPPEIPEHDEAAIKRLEAPAIVTIQHNPLGELAENATADLIATFNHVMPQLERIRESGHTVKLRSGEIYHNPDGSYIEPWFCWEYELDGSKLTTETWDRQKKSVPHLDLRGRCLKSDNTYGTWVPVTALIRRIMKIF